MTFLEIPNPGVGKVAHSKARLNRWLKVTTGCFGRWRQIFILSA
jgi:hypothetical protein